MTVSDNYPRGVPISIKYPLLPVYSFLENSARKFPNRDAVIYYGAHHRYGDLWSQVRCFAGHLHRLGVQKGDCVALLLPNTPQFVVAFNAVELLGGITVALNPLMPKAEIDRQIDLTDSHILIILDRLMEQLPDNYEGTLIVAEAAAYAPVHLRLLSRLRYSTPKLPSGALRFEGLTRGEPVRELPVIDPHDDVAVVLFTSGTTGLPKGVMLTHYNLVANALQSYHWLRGWGYVAKPQMRGWPVILCAMPFFHSYGMVVMNEAVSFGCTMVLLPDPDAETIMKVTDRHRVTHFPLIPRFIREILNHPKLSRYDLTSLSHCSSGGAAIPVEHMKAFEKVCGARFYQGYGLTEAGPSTHATPVEGDPNYESVGLSYPDTETRVVDLQLGEIEMPPGVEGEILVRGPQVMKGYWGDPDATAEVLRDGWLHTGDTGHLDERGYLYVVGRKEYRISAGGHTVWPTEVEDVLQRHPDVSLAVALGVPDPLRCSTDIQAIVVPETGASVEALEKELLEYCASHLEPYEVPNRIIFRESLPVTVMGKVDRRRVLEEVEHKIQDALRAELGKPVKDR
jgi:long-chain acyl-CoA synthetase